MKNYLAIRVKQNNNNKKIIFIIIIYYTDYIYYTDQEKGDKVNNIKNHH